MKVNKKELPVAKESSIATIKENKPNVKVLVPLKESIQAFVETRDRLKALDDEYEKNAEPLKQAKAHFQAQIIEEFKRRGEFSTKIEGATASLSVRKTAVVVDEATVIKQLQDKGLDQYYSIQLNDLFEEVKKQIADGTVTFEGVVIKETEFVSVRSNDKKDARKLSTGDFKKIGGKHA